MPNYHLYFMLRGAPVGTTSIEASDDAEAARIARELNTGDAVELWNDHRRLRILGPARLDPEPPAGRGFDAAARAQIDREKQSWPTTGPA